ncbi:unnamed protein product, partial [Prorocentrum cordatum]
GHHRDGWRGQLPVARLLPRRSSHRPRRPRPRHQKTADDPPRGHGGPRGARRPHGHGGGSRLAGQRHVEQFDGIAADVDRFGGRAAEVHDHRGQRQPMVQ